MVPSGVWHIKCVYTAPMSFNRTLHLTTACLEGVVAVRPPEAPDVYRLSDHTRTSLYYRRCTMSRDLPPAAAYLLLAGMCAQAQVLHKIVIETLITMQQNAKQIRRLTFYPVDMTHVCRNRGLLAWLWSVKWTIKFSWCTRSALRLNTLGREVRFDRPCKEPCRKKESLISYRCRAS